MKDEVKRTGRVDDELLGRCEAIDAATGERSEREGNKKFNRKKRTISLQKNELKGGRSKKSFFPLLPTVITFLLSSSLLSFFPLIRHSLTRSQTFTAAVHGGEAAKFSLIWLQR